MTAAEKTRLLAQLVHWDGARCFEPLTNLVHAGEVLEAMVRKGFQFDAQDCGVGKYKSWFRAPGVGAQAYAPLLSTAICHAALLATGVKEEEL